MAVDHFLELWPKPTHTNLAIGKSMAFKSDLYDDVRHALDFEESN
jgi:hypothetical protein